MKRIINKASLVVLLVALIVVGFGYDTVSEADSVNNNSQAQGIITVDKLKKELDKEYSKLSMDELDDVINIRGINHVDDELLAKHLTNSVDKLNRVNGLLNDLYVKNPSAEQVLRINNQLMGLQSDRLKAKEALRTARMGNADADTLQILANTVANIDGKISELQSLLNIPNQIKSLERKVTSIKDKFALAVKEQGLRSAKLVSRTYIHSIYYMDFNAHAGHLTGTVTFTNGSATVTGSGTAFTTELANGNYIRVSNGTEWYKVTARGSNTSLTIDPAFQQTTVTDTAGATYFNNGDGTTIAENKAFCHLNQYTTDTTRTAGDVLKVRANQTHVIAGLLIQHDEDGTPTAYLEVRGCSSTDDPFSDSSNVQPIFSFGNTGYRINLDTDDYWRYFNVTITNSNGNAIGLLQTSDCIGITVDTCTIYGNNHASGYGIRATNTRLKVLNSVFYSNTLHHIYNTCYLQVDNCIFNGGAGTTDYAIYTYNAVCDISNSTFGVTTAHDVADIRTSPTDTSIVYIRNCNLADSVKVSWATSRCKSGQVLSEDDGQVLGAQTSWQPNGTITKDATAHGGGASSSAKMMPAATYCTTEYPLTIAESKLVPDFAVWCPASATTVTIYIRATDTWSSYPTASQLYIQAEYYDNASGSTRAKSTASTQTISDGSTWVAFTTTFTPAVAGYVYLKVYLGKYESGKGIYVDIKPTVS